MSGDRSPAYAELREIVRPAIVARDILRLQLERSSSLVSEAKSLIALTEELLVAIGLAEVHITSANQVTAPECTHPSPQPPAAQLAATYARAGMAWTEVLSSAMGLATGLIAEGQPTGAERIADSLHALGETSLAAELRSQVERQKRVEEAAAQQAAAAIQSDMDAQERAAAQEQQATADARNVRQLYRISDERLDAVESTVNDGRQFGWKGDYWLLVQAGEFLAIALDALREANALASDSHETGMRMARLVQLSIGYVDLRWSGKRYGDQLQGLKTRATHAEDLDSHQIEEIITRLQCTVKGR